MSLGDTLPTGQAGHPSREDRSAEFDVVVVGGGSAGAVLGV